MAILWHILHAVIMSCEDATRPSQPLREVGKGQPRHEGADVRKATGRLSDVWQAVPDSVDGVAPRSTLGAIPRIEGEAKEPAFALP